METAVDVSKSNKPKRAQTPPKGVQAPPKEERSKVNMLRVGRIMHKQFPHKVEAGQRVFYMTFMRGSPGSCKAETVRCTQAVARILDRGDYQRMFARYDFQLTFDESEVVTKVEPVAKPASMQGFKQETEEGEVKSARSDTVVAQKTPNGFQIVSFPVRVTNDMVSELLGLLEAEPNLDVDTILGDRYQITHIAKERGLTTFNIDPFAAAA